MAVGKNKKAGKGRKSNRRRIADPFLKKERYDVRAPNIFPVKNVGTTIATKTTGTKVARDNLMGRIFEVSLGDLKIDGDDEAFRKFRLKVEDVKGNHCLTNFCGMDITTDKLRSLVRKWQSLIEAYVDVKTTDGYSLRLFCIGFTRRVNPGMTTAYAQTSQVRAIRKKMVEIIQREASNCDLNGVVDKLMSEIIGHTIEKQTQSIYPLFNVIIRKVKLLRSPKVDVTKLLELHGGQENLPQQDPKPVLDLGAKVAQSSADKAKSKKKGDKDKDKEEKDDDEVDES